MAAWDQKLLTARRSSARRRPEATTWRAPNGIVTGLVRSADGRGEKFHQPNPDQLRDAGTDTVEYQHPPPKEPQDAHARGPYRMTAATPAGKQAEITINPVTEVVELADSAEGQFTRSNTGEGDATIERYRPAA